MSETNIDNRREFYNSAEYSPFNNLQPPPPRQSSLPPFRRGRTVLNNSAKEKKYNNPITSFRDRYTLNSSSIGRQRYPSFNSRGSSIYNDPSQESIDGTMFGNSQKSSIVDRRRYPSFNSSYRSSRDGGPLGSTIGNSTEGNSFYNRRYANANAKPCSCRSSEAGPLQETYRTEPGNSISEFPYNRDKIRLDSIAGNTRKHIHKVSLDGMINRGVVNRSKNGLASISDNASKNTRDYFLKRLPTLENSPPIDNSAYSPRPGSIVSQINSPISRSRSQINFPMRDNSAYSPMPSSQVSRQQINSPISRSRSQINSPMSDNSSFDINEINSATRYRNSIKLPPVIPFKNEKNTLERADGNFKNFFLSDRTLFGYNAITYILEPMLIQLKSFNYKYAYLYIEKDDNKYESNTEINYIATENKINKADNNFYIYGICELDFNDIDYITNRDIRLTTNKSKIFIDIDKYKLDSSNTEILSFLNNSISSARGTFHLREFKPSKTLLGGIRKRNTKKYLKTDKIYIDKCKITRKVYELNGIFYIKKKSKKTEKFQYRKINLKSPDKKTRK